MTAARTTIGVLVLFWCGTAIAQGADDYPAKPVRVVVELAPGGGTDIQVRLFAPQN